MGQMKIISIKKDQLYITSVFPQSPKNKRNLTLLGIDVWKKTLRYLSQKCETAVVNGKGLQTASQ